MITINDIQIFVTTHNRASLIKETLESLLAQTAGITHIIVLDNDSTDNTKEIVQSFSSRGVEYRATTGFLGNFLTARNLVKKPYCMLFHDDDLLHPDYLKNALKLLNKYSNISLLTCNYTPFFHGKTPVFSSHPSLQHSLFQTPKSWACYMYFVEGISYAPAIYRTDAFLKTELEYDKFNKFNDWPFLAKLSLHGNVIFIHNPDYMYCRKHPGQDTNNSQNYPNLEQISNWDKCFFTLMGSPTWKNSLYWIYGCYNKHFLAGKYKAAPKSLKEENSLSELKKTIKEKGLPTWSFGPLGRLLRHLFLLLHIIGPKSSKFWTK